MPDTVMKLAVRHLLLDLKDAAAAKGNSNRETAQNCQDRLALALSTELSADQRKALKQVFEINGRWVRCSGGTAERVRKAVERAIPLFEH